ncbi:MAG: hypothetical protein ACAI35_05765 [Candidatus Methylacidiphilales bacterium]
MPASNRTALPTTSCITLRLMFALAVAMAFSSGGTARAQSIIPAPAASEVEQIIQRQRAALPPFRAVWKQDVTQYGNPGEQGDVTGMLDQLKESVTKLEVEISQEKDPDKKAVLDDRMKKLKESLEKLEKVSKSEADKKAPDRKSTMTVTITYLSPERFTVVMEDVSGKPGLTRRIYKNNGPVYTVREGNKTVIIYKPSARYLECFPLPLPEFSIDDTVAGLLEEFELKKEQDAKGFRYSGTYLPDLATYLREEGKEITPELAEKIAKSGPAKVSITFDSTQCLQEILYTHGDVNRMSTVYSHYTEKDGVKVPREFNYESMMVRIDNEAKREQMSIKYTLQDFRKLTNEEIQSASVAYELKPGYRVLDERGPEPVETTSEAILNQTSTTK